MLIIGKIVYDVDPFFHYHYPRTNEYFYLLNNERSQNNGISKHFNYDTLITGTSMAENFKCSEMDAIFGTNSIKVPFFGGTYKEINDNVRTGLENNSELRIVVRGLDMGRFFDTCDLMRFDLGKYPTYLYDENPFNDVSYLWNKDIIFNRVYPMMKNKEKEDFVPGITNFDAYSNWQFRETFGVHTVCPDGITVNCSGEELHLTVEEKTVIAENIQKNVVSLPKEYPDVDFYYFFPPYSVVWWKGLIESGNIYRQLEAEQYIIELLLLYENIKLYSFNNRFDLTTDLNHYKDASHYGEWVNSAMLYWMKEGLYLLTLENYQSYLKEERDFYLSFDYESLNEQKDYENDFCAAALLSKEFSGVEPLDLLSNVEYLNLAKASLSIDSDNGAKSIVCVGRLNREPQNSVTIYDYLLNDEYIGVKISIPQEDQYNYLIFDGKKNADHGHPTVYVYNSFGKKVAEFRRNYAELDEEYHQYVIDLSSVTEATTIIFNGGYIDQTGDALSSYTFRNIYLY